MGSLPENKDYPLRIFQFDNPRTNCHAFYKLFSQLPQLGWGKFYHGYSSAALYGPERIQQHFKHSDAAEKTQNEWGTEYGAENQKTYESSTKDLLEKIEETEKEGKIFFGKEHIICLLHQDLILSQLRNPTPSPAKTNPTYIPSHILQTLTPIFVIRHPILMVGSQYRVQQPIMGQLPTDEDFIAFSSLRWCRILFDYFVSQGQKPALVDAEDVIWKTKATTDKLCAQLGIDPEGIKDTWDPVPKEYWPDHKIAIAFTGDMMGSKGIERRGKEPAEWTLNIDTETEKWRKMYGDDVASGLRKIVEVEMPVYEYLRGFKINP